MPYCKYKSQNKICQQPAEVAYEYIKQEKKFWTLRCSDHLVCNREVIKAFAPCPFCQLGFIQRFSHVAQGNCFRCKGRGYNTFYPYAIPLGPYLMSDKEKEVKND